MDTIVEKVVGPILTMKNCQHLVVVMGADSDVFREREEKQVEGVYEGIGVYPVHVWSPFPASQLLQSTSAAIHTTCVVERLEEPEELSFGPLYLKVVGAFQESLEHTNMHIVSFTYQVPSLTLLPPSLFFPLPLLPLPLPSHSFSLL